MDRKISSGLLGLVTAVIVLIAARYLGHLVVPGEAASHADGQGSVSFAYQLVEVLAWFLGVQAGIWSALLLSNGSRRATVIVAGGVLAIITLILFSVPHPAWMVAIGLLLPVLSVYVATRVIPFEPV
ncbi:MAG: hypothetical protein R3C13_04210 [Hyphomonas sp.]|uniref:hypothetical protein n=1 Tax=Hyphomonas sp. TaxID=87 RepID=UPI003527A948